MTKIARCPYCGSSRVRVIDVSLAERRKSLDGHSVNCRRCEACGPIRRTDRLAVITWNLVAKKALGYR